MDTHTHTNIYTLMHTRTTHNKLIKTCQKEAMQLAEDRGGGQGRWGSVTFVDPVTVVPSQEIYEG